MGFYRFLSPVDGEVYVDLDMIHAVRKSSRYCEGTAIATPSGTLEVNMPIHDVLRLISPPPPQAAPTEHVILGTVDIPQGAMGPDGSCTVKVTMDLADAEPPIPGTYKEELAQSKSGERLKFHYPDKYGIIRELEAGPPEAMSVTDRRARLDELDLIERAVKAEGWWSGSWISRWIQKRRREIEQERA